MAKSSSFGGISVTGNRKDILSVVNLLWRMVKKSRPKEYNEAQDLDFYEKNLPWYIPMETIHQYINSGSKDSGIIDIAFLSLKEDGKKLTLFMTFDDSVFLYESFVALMLLLETFNDNTFNIEYNLYDRGSNRYYSSSSSNDGNKNTLWMENLEKPLASKAIRKIYNLLETCDEKTSFMSKSDFVEF